MILVWNWKQSNMQRWGARGEQQRWASPAKLGFSSVSKLTQTLGWFRLWGSVHFNLCHFYRWEWLQELGVGRGLAWG